MESDWKKKLFHICHRAEFTIKIGSQEHSPVLRLMTHYPQEFQQLQSNTWGSTPATVGWSQCIKEQIDGDCRVPPSILEHVISQQVTSLLIVNTILHITLPKSLFTSSLSNPCLQPILMLLYHVKLCWTVFVWRWSVLINFTLGYMMIEKYECSFLWFDSTQSF